MSFESARRSSQEMKEAQREMLDRAKQAQPAVVLTEANWKALIASQQDQVRTLGQILDGANTLASREELSDWLNQTLNILQREAIERDQAWEQYKQDLTAAASKQTLLLEAAVKETKIQVGNMQEKFSYSLSQEQEQMSSVRRRLFLISLIPSLTLVILEWTLRIWPLIFPG